MHADVTGTGWHHVCWFQKDNKKPTAICLYPWQQDKLRFRWWQGSLVAGLKGNIHRAGLLCCCLLYSEIWCTSHLKPKQKVGPAELSDSQNKSDANAMWHHRRRRGGEEHDRWCKFTPRIKTSSCVDKNTEIIELKQGGGWGQSHTLNISLYTTLSIIVFLPPAPQKNPFKFWEICWTPPKTPVA